MPIILTDDPASQAPLDPLPDIIQFGSVNLLSGASGVGKTCLTAWLATRFRDVTPIFDLQPNPVAKIAYVCADRGWKGTLEWFRRAGYPDIACYSLIDDLGFDPNRLYNKRALVPLLAICLDRLDLPVGSLVFVDPLALFMGGNLNDYFACAVALIAIRRLCIERGITLIGLTHAGKQKNDKAEQYQRLQDRILGSAAQHGYGDTQMYLASPDETGKAHYTFLLHPHLVKPREIALGRDETTGLFLPIGQLREVEGGIRIAAELAGSPHAIPVHQLVSDTDTGSTTAEVLDAAKATLEISRATTFRVINLLATAGWLVSLGRGRWKRLPLTDPAVAPALEMGET